jgi:hypothetical protein
MPILDSTDPDDVAPILALLIQEAELPDIPGSSYRRELWAFNAIAEDGKTDALGQRSVQDPQDANVRTRVDVQRHRRSTTVMAKSLDSPRWAFG